MTPPTFDIKTQIKLIGRWSQNHLLLGAPLPFALRRAILHRFGGQCSNTTLLHRGIRVFEAKNITIGERSVINRSTLLDGRGGLSIGDDVMISSDVVILTAGHDLDLPGFDLIRRSVSVGDNAVIFPRSIVNPGVTIGESAVVLTGSVVTKSVEPWTVVGGNPAKPIRSRGHQGRTQAYWPYHFTEI